MKKTSFATWLLAMMSVACVRAAAVEAAPMILSLPGPELADLQPRFHSALDRVRNQVVAVNLGGGEASGVLISTEGLVATAGHVAMNMKPGELADIILEDGRKMKAELLGRDLEIDFALLRITPKPTADLPHAVMASKVPLPGAYCFVLAHPSGRIEGRPAQPRMGRILNIAQREGKPWLGMMDCEIQPGDSGGPVFDLDGKLIGVASSAAGHKRFNRFGVIDQLRSNMEFLLKPGNARGVFEKGPGGLAGYEHKFTAEEMGLLENLLRQRVQDEHQQTMVFVKSKLNDKGQATIDGSDLVNFFYLDALAVADHRPYNYGLDDPALLKPLAKLGKPTGARLKLQVSGKDVGFALHVGKHLAIAPSDLIPDSAEHEVMVLSNKNKPSKARVIKRANENDLCLLEIPAEIDGPVVDFKNATNDLTAGDLLLGIDASSCVVLGNAMDQAREIKKADSEGPVGDSIPLSHRRGPFASVVNHSVPLYAGDAGTPMFTLDGHFAGMHVARSTRTYGVLVRPVELEALMRNGDLR